jgi:Sel1 repeat
VYFRGAGVSKDNAEAVRWFRKAADQGYSYGEYDLATVLARGRGVPRDRSAAMRFFRWAAAHGDPAAQRYVTVPLTPWKRIVLMLIFLFSVWMLTEFFYDWPAHANDPQRRRFDVMLAVFWALNAALTGVNWYGYTHHKILCITCGMNAFTACHYILEILVLAGVITVLRTGKRSAADEPSGPDPGSEPGPDPSRSVLRPNRKPGPRTASARSSRNGTPPRRPPRGV